MIGRNGERGSGISALAARHDDDDEITGKGQSPNVHGQHQTVCKKKKKKRKRIGNSNTHRENVQSRHRDRILN